MKQAPAHCFTISTLSSLKLCSLGVRGVVDWKKFSKEFQAEYRKPYLIYNCSSCGTTFKDCGAVYWGNGKQGQLRGFYSEPITPGYCSHFCAMDAGFRCGNTLS
ncbi:hypothetical protein ILYODFUR_035721 [Ilyodon furcidens]|uniref:CxC7-like cysteine cluster associated with KDZ transposases domain-containing protein n=1 Tax=Ilyodon furcidens TaxID=33524 RepID=A0ABV0T3A0_9TELE